MASALEQRAEWRFLFVNTNTIADRRWLDAYGFSLLYGSIAYVWVRARDRP